MSRVLPRGKGISEIGFALADTTRLARAAFDLRMKRAGLRGATWRVLAYLNRSDGQTQTQLAELLEVSRAAIGQMIDQLEAANLVHRRPDQRDARCWRVHLSDGARDALPALQRSARSFEEELFSGFSSSELQELSRLVNKLHQRVVVMARHGTEEA